MKHIHKSDSPIKLTSSRVDRQQIYPKKGGPPETLKPDERCQFEKYEEVLRKGLGTFFEVGNALLAIREDRLYREEFSTFEAYCQGRWAIGRNYAWRLMGAAERVRLLPADTKSQKPANEFQVRPFLKLEPAAFPQAWEEVISKAKNGKITPALVRSVVSQMTSQEGSKMHSANRLKKPTGLPRGCSVGGLVVLLTEARRGIEKGDIKKAIEIIERLESELLGT